MTASSIFVFASDSSRLCPRPSRKEWKCRPMSLTVCICFFSASLRTRYSWRMTLFTVRASSVDLTVPVSIVRYSLNRRGRGAAGDDDRLAAFDVNEEDLVDREIADLHVGLLVTERGSARRVVGQIQHDL